jgi:hypothetical protein
MLRHRNINAIRTAVLGDMDRRIKFVTWEEYESIRYNRIDVHAVTHLGARGQNTRRDRIEPEWYGIGERFRHLKLDS